MHHVGQNQWKKKQKQHSSQQKQHNRNSTQHKIILYSSVAISVRCWCSQLALVFATCIVAGVAFRVCVCHSNSYKHLTFIPFACISLNRYRHGGRKFAHSDWHVQVGQYRPTDRAPRVICFGLSPHRDRHRCASTYPFLTFERRPDDANA